MLRVGQELSRLLLSEKELGTAVRQMIDCSIVRGGKVTQTLRAMHDIAL